MAEVEEGLLRVAVRPESYLEELTAKVAAARARFDLAGLSELPEPVVFESARQHFRQHAEFGVWHNGVRLLAAVRLDSTSRASALAVLALLLSRHFDLHRH